MRRTVMRETLRLAVPMHMVELEGLPADMLTGIATAAAVTVGTHGDDLQFGGKRCAATFNSLARGLAAAALTAWGGVTWEGLHWCAIPGCSDPHGPHPEPTCWHRRLESRPVVELPLPGDGEAA